MTLVYGFVKTKITSEPKLKPSRHSHETQFHLHCNLDVDGDKWDVAINVGTNDADDLLKYKLAFDFRHPVIQTLAATEGGSHELTDQIALPALDFLRSDVLENTGKWRDSDVMDGSEGAEPAASLKRLLSRASGKSRRLYLRPLLQRGQRPARRPSQSGIEQGIRAPSRRRFQRPQRCLAGRRRDG